MLLLLLLLMLVDDSEEKIFDIVTKFEEFKNETFVLSKFDIDDEDDKLFNRLKSLL